MTTDERFTFLRRGLLALVVLLAAAPGPKLYAETLRLPRAIVVHGHWTIDVVRRDGTRVSHNEFENALQPAGAAFIATALATTLANSPTGTIFNGKWRIAVTAVQPGTPPCHTPNIAGQILNGPCLMVDPLDVIGGTPIGTSRLIAACGGRCHAPISRLVNSLSPCTSVRRMSRLWYRYVSRVWSIPIRRRMVAFKS